MPNILKAQGYIVPNGVVTNLYYGLPGEISVNHNPTSPNPVYTGFFFNPIGKTQPTTYTNTFQFDSIVDVGVRVFLIASNQPITASALAAQTYPEFLGGNYVFANNSPFYVALYTGNMTYYPTNGVYDDPLFGWALLVNNQGAIQLLDSALTYQAIGIYAGTQTIIQVPEPSTFALAMLSGVLLSLRCWKRS